MKDDALVARAKQGDPEAWRELYRTHAGRLVAWLGTRPTGDSTMSPEDVAGEAWLVAASKIAEFHGSSDDFGGWLFGIARKVAATARRTAERRRTQTGDVHEHLAPVEDPSRRVDQNDWVRSTLSVLPDRERDVIALVDGLGVDRATAAEILGISPVALRVARHRGLKRLGRGPVRPQLEVLQQVAPGV